MAPWRQGRGSNWALFWDSETMWRWTPLIPPPTEEDARRRKKIRTFAGKESREVAGEGEEAAAIEASEVAGAGRRMVWWGKMPQPFFVRWGSVGQTDRKAPAWLIDFGQKTFIFKINNFFFETKINNLESPTNRTRLNIKNYIFLYGMF